jgi:HAD superfamily hydrolase (TIGR01490 family)
MTKSNKVAVFDIDGTLYRNNLTWDLFSQLVHQRLIPKRAMSELERLYVAHDSRSTESAYRVYDSQLINLLYSYASNIKDMNAYWSIGEELAERNATRLYRYTRELLEQLRAQDYHLITITNGIGAIARPFAKRLGFETIIANDEVIDESTGAIVDWSISMQTRQKSAVLKQLVDSHQLDLNDSYGVGDTLSDASVLSMVAHPIAFNPERQLYEVALRNGWPVVLERKNVIYKLNSSQASDKAYTMRVAE